MSDLQALKTEYLALLDSQLDADQRAWLSTQCRSILEAPSPEDALLNASAAARRQCGDSLLKAHASTELSLTEAARLVLILTACTDLDGPERDTLLKNFYRYGDEFEKATLLKNLYQLDTQGALLQLTLQACRVNSLLIFNAIALNNPYPAAHFPELNWNQLVLKSAFQKLDLNAIAGFDERRNSALSHMCLDYAEELELADREPIPSLWRGIVLNDVDEKGCDFFARYLRHADTAHRRGILKSLSSQRTESQQALIALQPKLSEGLQREDDADCRALLTTLLK